MMTVLLRPNQQVASYYPEFARFISNAYHTELPGWKRCKDKSFEDNRIYEILFLGAFTSSAPWSILAWHDKKGKPWFSYSAWQWGDGGQGFTDTPTHYRDVLL
jgi:hypothetical protein